MPESDLHEAYGFDSDPEFQAAIKALPEGEYLDLSEGNYNQGNASGTGIVWLGYDWRIDPYFKESGIKLTIRHVDCPTYPGIEDREALPDLRVAIQECAAGCVEVFRHLGTRIGDLPDRATYRDQLHTLKRLTEASYNVSYDDGGSDLRKLLDRVERLILGAKSISQVNDTLQLIRGIRIGQSVESRPMPIHDELTEEIEGAIAKMVWADCWAAWADTRPEVSLSGCEIYGLLPDEVPNECVLRAQEIRIELESANGAELGALYLRAQAACQVAGSEAEEADRFGSDLAHMAMGSGVSWFDDNAEFDLAVPGFESLDPSEIADPELFGESFGVRWGTTQEFGTWGNKTPCVFLLESPIRPVGSLLDRMETETLEYLQEYCDPDTWIGTDDRTGHRCQASDLFDFE
ncbi:MAG: hypothetical protein JKY94_16855 [Rhodobacteraceae bacterium]|nr:hypothetical protein [Paracoccaceae bacterium]